MKRAVVFAHYDKDNIVDDYVLYYLEALKKVSSYIVFVSCNPIVDKNCLENIADFVIDEKHDEYDFGSYKRGFLHLKDKLNEFDELIFANDSCYGPFFPLQPIFDCMEKFDFWGFTKNRIGFKKIYENKFKLVKRPHLQSYFLAFKKNVFTSETFENLINSVKHHENKKDIIVNYEIGLSEVLRDAGFSGGSYIKHYQHFGNSMIYFWRQLIQKYKMPFVKCSVLRHKDDHITCSDGWKEVIAKRSDYPVSLIEKNLKRTSAKDQFPNIPTNIKRIYFSIIAVVPKFLKRPLIKLGQALIS